MKSFFRSFPYSTFLISILCMGLGLSLLLWPDHAMTVMCYGFGGVLILAGILQTVIYIAGEKKGLVQKLMLLSGFIAAVVGVWLLFSPDKVRTLAMIVMGIVLLYHGGMDIKYAFDIKNCGGRTWTAAGDRRADAGQSLQNGGTALPGGRHRLPVRRHHGLLHVLCRRDVQSPL